MRAGNFRVIRVLEENAKITSTRKMGSELRVSQRLMRTLQAPESPSWMIPQKFHNTNYRVFTIHTRDLTLVPASLYSLTIIQPCIIKAK